MNTKAKILLIEDDKKKTEDIRAFLSSYLSDVDLVIKESYQSGLRELLFNSYDLLLLDMSIPTWDRSSKESGGNYEKFGGYKILKETVRKRKSVRTILITMFDDFGEGDTSITLSELNQMLESEFPEIYKGAVFYSSRESNWKDELKTLVDQEIQA